MAAKSSAGRKALAAAEKAGPEFIGKTPDEDAAQQLALREHEAVLIEGFGDGLPWHPDHYEAAIRGELRRGCEAFLRAGRYLVVARECALHGEWQGMLDRLGMAQDQAWRMMEAAKRMAALPNHATSHDLTAAAGNQSKFIELLSLPEDQFTELAETGETNGLTLDSIATMGVRELREALREARTDLETKGQLVADRDRKISSLQEKNAKAKRDWQKATPDEITTTLRNELDMEALHLGASITASDDGVASLRNRVAVLIDHAEDQGEAGDQRVYLAGVFAQLERYLHMVRDEFMIPRAAVGDPATEARMSLDGEA